MRCYFVDKQGHIHGVEVIDAATPAEGIEKALACLERHPSAFAVELWDGAKCLYPNPPEVSRC